MENNDKKDKSFDLLSPGICGCFVLLLCQLVDYIYIKIPTYSFKGFFKLYIALTFPFIVLTVKDGLRRIKMDEKEVIEKQEVDFKNFTTEELLDLLDEIRTELLNRL